MSHITFKAGALALALIRDYRPVEFYSRFIHFFVTAKILTAVMAGNVTYVIDDDLPSNNLVRQIVFIILVMYITNSASIFGHYANCE